MGGKSSTRRPVFLRVLPHHFDLIQHLFGIHIAPRVGDVGINVGFDAHLFHHMRNEGDEARQFVLGEQVDLQIEVGAAAFFAGLAVLGDEQKRGQKNRLDRRPHRQDDELRVELMPAMRPSVPRDPAAKQGEVQVNEPHAAREARDGARHTFFQT